MSITMYPKQFVWVFSYEYIYYIHAKMVRNSSSPNGTKMGGLNNGVPPTYHTPLSHSSLYGTSSQGAECSYFSDAGPWT